MLMRRSGTSSMCLTSNNGWTTPKGVRHWGCFCEPYSLSCKPRSWSYRYPLVFSFVILPVSAARWSQFSGRHVPSAATFFGVSMHNLSGAINVLLLLTVRPQLLLLIRPDPEEFSDHEIELPPRNPRRNGDAILPEAANYQHSPTPTTTALPDGSGSDNSAAVSRVSSRRIPVDV
jgi:hypothetical protein